MSANNAPDDCEPNCSQDPSVGRAKKRHKTAVACIACRTRKVKCDGLRPACGVCLRRGTNGLSSNCSYDDEKEGAFLTSIWAREVSNVHSPGPHPPSLNPTNFNVFRGSGESAITTQGLVQKNIRELSFHVDFPSCAARTRSNADAYENSKGIDSMTGVIGEQDHGVGFFGSSSAGSFMTQIKSAIDAKLGPTSRRPSLSGSKAPLFSSYLAKHTNEVQRSNIEYILPSRKTADILMLVYWDLVHPLYPFLNRQMFQRAYDLVWEGSTPTMDERILMCTLNAVFALASQLSEGFKPEDRGEQAKSYFKRAQELLQLDLWDLGSTELIQCLLIMGQYLQSTNAPHQCWMIVGHAIRIAQSLGFHLPESSYDPPRHERQTSRIIWHGCVMMDRVLSMTFGRPAMISVSIADIVPLPEMDDAEELSRRTSHSELLQKTQPSMMAFFVESLRLYDIMNNILLELYMDVGRSRSKERPSFVSHQRHYDTLNMATILKLDQDLMVWGQNLPPHLRLSSPESAKTARFQRQSIVCRARFLHSRILLFRPILSHFCLSESSPPIPSTALDESLAHRMVFQCSNLCVRAAHDMIDLIHSNLDQDNLTGPLPAWWYCILYVYTAATVLLAARLQPTLSTGITNNSINISWNHAIQVLKSFERLGESAQRCVAALEILSAKVSKGQPHGVAPRPSSQHQEGNLETSISQVVPDVIVDDFNAGFDFTGIEVDLSDMSWLNILPGDLY